MSSVFSIALSSLKAESEAINTSGHNLANINTTGFKEGMVNFRDLVAASLSGQSTGLGVTKPLVQRIFSQGPLNSSESQWAAAIQGNGFFTMKQPSGQEVYTRSGNFTLSKDGLLQSLTGENVQGWTATPSGKIDTSSQIGNIQLKVSGAVAPNPTSSLSFTANLDAAGDPTTGSGNISVPVQIVDSLGTQHILNIKFTQSTSATNSWDYSVTIPSSDLASPGADADTQVTSGTLNFNTDGTLATSSLDPVTIPVTGLKNSANDLSITWDVKNADETGMFTQFAQKSSYNNLVQDGTTAGSLSDLGLSDDGAIVAKYSNGQQKTIAQLVLTSFLNQDSLQSVGNNNYASTGKSAKPVQGLSQTGNFGHIVSGQLEGSNVDMATEFTSLLSFQRGYQASSKVITTADNMAQDLLNLIR